MINEGDFVVCKRYKENECGEPFLPEVYYVVRNNTDYGIISIFNSKNDWTYFRTGREYFDSFCDYFYTLAEWRDKRINEVLDNE
jgi:hypothetical protein